MRKIVLATHNPGKVQELRLVMEGLGIEIISSAEAGFNQNIKEDQKSLEGNAIKKARVTSTKLGIPAVADDSGLFIDALGGKPGVYSKRWAGEDANDEERVRYTLERMEGVSKRKRGATFKTVAVLFFPDGKFHIFSGVVNGRISTKPRGSARPGMPYDLLFMPEDLNFTFAEMQIESKNHFSHRAKAFKQLRDHLEIILRRP